MESLLKFIERCKQVTELDVSHGKTTQNMVLSTVAEFGEFCEELRIEDGVFGHEHKSPDEGTLGEGVDFIICALACYFSRPGASFDHLAGYGHKKLDKWEGSIARAAQRKESVT